MFNVLLVIDDLRGRTDEQTHAAPESNQNTHLVQFEANETSSQRCGGGDGGNDFPGDLLRVVTISDGDSVVHGPQIGSSGDEVHVEIGVVVLLERGGNHPVSHEGRRRRKSRRNRREIVVVRRDSRLVRDGLVVLDLNLNSRARNEFGKADRVENFAEDRGVSLSFEAVVEGVKVRSCDNEVEMGGLLGDEMEINKQTNKKERKGATYVVVVESEGLRGSFRSRPERRPFLRHQTLGQTVKELSNLVVVFRLELLASPNNAFFEP